MKFDRIGRLDQSDGSAFTSFSQQYCLNLCINSTDCAAISYSTQNNECVAYKSYDPNKFENPQNLQYNTYVKEVTIKDRKFDYF